MLTQDQVTACLPNHRHYRNPYLDVGDYQRVLVVSPLPYVDVRTFVTVAMPYATWSCIRYDIGKTPIFGLEISGLITRAVSNAVDHRRLLVHLKIDRRLRIPRETGYSAALKIFSDTTDISAALVGYRFTDLILDAI